MNLKNTNLLTLVLTSLVIVVILNLVIPNIVLPYVKPEQQGKNDYNFGDQFMNLMYIHAKSPLLTSLVLIVIVIVSILLGSVIKIRPTTVKSIYN